MKMRLLAAAGLIAAQPCLAQRVDRHTQPAPAPPPGPSVPALASGLPVAPPALGEVASNAAYAKPLFRRPLGVSLNLGTQGAGVEGRLGIRPRVGVRIGASYLPADYATVVTVQNIRSEATLNSKLGNVRILGEFQPLPRVAWLRLVGGLGYFFSADATVHLRPEGTYHYGTIPLSEEQVGTVTGTLDWSGVAPYLGLGLFRFLPRRHFGASLDLGSYYLSKPNVTIDGTGMLADNKQNEAVVANNLSDYRWLPVVQLNLSYKIH